MRLEASGARISRKSQLSQKMTALQYPPKAVYVSALRGLGGYVISDRARREVADVVARVAWTAGSGDGRKKIDEQSFAESQRALAKKIKIRRVGGRSHELGKTTKSVVSEDRPKPAKTGHGDLGLSPQSAKCGQFRPAFMSHFTENRPNSITGASPISEKRPNAAKCGHRKWRRMEGSAWRGSEIFRGADKGGHFRTWPVRGTRLRSCHLRLAADAMPMSRMES